MQFILRQSSFFFFYKAISANPDENRGKEDNDVNVGEVIWQRCSVVLGFSRQRQHRDPRVAGGGDTHSPE